MTETSFLNKFKSKHTLFSNAVYIKHRMKQRMEKTNSKLNSWKEKDTKIYLI